MVQLNWLLLCSFSIILSNLLEILSPHFSIVLVELTCTAVIHAGLVEVIGKRSAVAEAEPAILVRTDDAGHVVAAVVLLHLRFADGTKPYAAVSCDPSFELFVHALFAR